MRTVSGSRGSLRQAFPLCGELLCGQLNQVGDMPSYLVQVQAGDQVQTGVGRVQRRHGRYPGLEAACGGGEVQPSRIERERINAPEPPGQRRIQATGHAITHVQERHAGKPEQVLAGAGDEVVAAQFVHVYREHPDGLVRVDEYPRAASMCQRGHLGDRQKPAVPIGDQRHRDQHGAVIHSSPVMSGIHRIGIGVREDHLRAAGALGQPHVCDRGEFLGLW